MDYEKEYKSLVAKVKKAHQFAQTDSTKSVLEDILPQLRESDDERIRQWIREHINHDGTNMFDKAVAWLEKQKERGPLTKEEEYLLHRIIEYLEDEVCPSEWISLLYDIYCLPYEKQKEQKPAEWSEEDEFFRQQLIVYCENCVQDTLAAKCVDWLKSLRPQPHWKPSEEKMENLEMCFTPSGVMPDFCVLESLYNDLKKLM